MKSNLLKRSVGVGALFFMTVMNGQNSESIIRDYISTEVSFKSATNLDFKVLNENNSASLKSNIVDVQQYYNGVPVYRTLGKAVIRDGKVFSFNNNFEKQLEVSKNKSNKDIKSAFQTVMAQLGLDAGKYQLMESDANRSATAKDSEVYSRFYYANDNKRLVPAQQFFIDDSANNAFWSVLVSLENNQIIEKSNMVISCSFDHNHADDILVMNESEATPSYYTVANKSFATTKADVPNANYNVFKLPVEAPTFGTRQMVSNPWDLVASPLGWHQNGVANYIHTRGNNVHAYFDNAGTNTPPTTDITNGNSALTFDYPYTEGTTVSAYDNKHAAITNLFYMNNMMHDIFFKFGFVESARNFQWTNFSGEGKGFDAVNAEAYDGSGYSNANFNAGYESSTGVQAPRMQMYLWNSGTIGSTQRVFYNQPADAVTRPAFNTGMANFGKPIMSIPTTGDIAIPSDNTSCTALTAGSLTGKIAMVTSTGCAYNVKVKNAQLAGAKGVIVHRTNSNTTSTMGDTNNGTTGITIPSVMIGMDEGNYINSQITNGVTVNVDLKDFAYGYKNSSFDNGVIAHEYGHGISNRMTGSGSGCLSNAEQMGEGWSDFFGLMLTNKPEYTSTTARGMATYSAGQGPTGAGIRGRKYSTDMTVNGYTYNSIRNAGSPHDVGQVWATILWDLHWKMAEKYGYNYDITADPNSGSAKTMQLVMDGLSLQPCSPDFVTGRDAIIQASVLKGGADECLIWGVFARRGVGFGANAGTATSVNDQTESTEVPDKCKLATNEVGKSKAYNVYPNPAKGEFFIAGKPTLSAGVVKVEILDASGKLVKSFERKKNATESVSTKGMSKGIYVVSITEGGKVIQADKLIVE